MKRLSRFLLVLTVSLILAACNGGGGSSDSGGNAGTTSSISGSGTVGMATVANAQVNIYRIIDGQRQSTPAVQTTTDENGAYSFTIPDCPQPCLYAVEATGGNYVDEATGENRSIPADNPIRAMGAVPAGENTVEVYVTPITEAGAKVAEQAANNLTEEALNEANAKMAVLLGLDVDAEGENAASIAKKLLGTPPADATVGNNGTLSDEARLYGILLGALSELEKQTGNLQDVINNLVDDSGNGFATQKDHLKQAAEIFLNSDANATGISGDEANIITDAIDEVVNNSDIKHAANDIVSFYIPGIESLDISYIDHEINATMPSGSSVNALTPQVGVSFRASVAPASGVTQDFTNGIEYVVTAENGSTQTWLINVTAPAQSAAANILAVKSHEVIVKAIVNASKRVVRGSVKEGGLTTLDTLAVAELFDISANASIGKVDSTDNFADDGEVQYRVTAEDGTNQKTWTVRFKETGKETQPDFYFVNTDNVKIHKLTKVIGDAVFGVSVSGGHSGLSGSVAYRSSHPEVATIDNAGQVTLHGSGETILTASKPGGEVTEGGTTTTYHPAEAQLLILVDKQQQAEFTFTNINKTFGMPAFELQPSASGSGTGDIRYLVSNPGVAAVSDNQVTLVGAGSTNITAKKAGDNTYHPAETTFTLTVAKANQTGFGFVTDPVNKTYTDDPFTQAASGGQSSGTVQYSSSDAAIASVDSSVGLVAIHGVGQVTITATKAGDANYHQTTASYVLNVSKAMQPALQFAQASIAVVVGGKATNTISGGAGGGAITYSSSDSMIASVDSTTGEVSAIAEGSATITASKAGDANYLDATPVNYTVTVSAAPPENCVWDNNNWDNCVWQ